MTFFLENENQYSAGMVLRKAYNTLNECFALKSPLFYEEGIEAIEYKKPLKKRYRDTKRFKNCLPWKNIAVHWRFHI